MAPRWFSLVLACWSVTSGAHRALAQGIPADTIVRLAQRPLHPGVATLVEELSIGVADGAEEYMLGEIADIALGRDGSIYALDRQVPAVRHFDALGSSSGTSAGRARDRESSAPYQASQ